MSKYAEAADRALLRRTVAARQAANAPPPQEKSSRGMWIAIILILICGIGAWTWYTDDTESDLDRLAAEVRTAPLPADDADYGGAGRFMWRRLAKFGVAIAIFAVGYMRLKSSLSP